MKQISTLPPASLDAEEAASTRLIAAAPDMLAAIDYALSQLGQHKQPNAATLNNIQGVLAAALDKATL